MRAALLPASFDPITCGHVDIATRAAALFDRLVVAVYAHPRKNVMFSLDDRLAMVRESLAHLQALEVTPFEGLLVDFARRIGVPVVIRGLRTATDFEYEYQQAVLNRRMYSDFEAVSLFSSPEYAVVSSTMVKEIAENGGDVSSMVPGPVLRRLKDRFGQPAPQGAGG